MKYENIKFYYEEDFNALFGVSRVLFNEMLKVLVVEYKKKMNKGGRKPKLSIEQILYVTLDHSMKLPTYAFIAKKHNIDEANIYRSIKWVEDTLLKNGFTLPKKINIGHHNSYLNTSNMTTYNSEKNQYKVELYTQRIIATFKFIFSIEKKALLHCDNICNIWYNSIHKKYEKKYTKYTKSSYEYKIAISNYLSDNSEKIFEFDDHKKRLENIIKDISFNVEKYEILKDYNSKDYNCDYINNYRNLKKLYKVLLDTMNLLKYLNKSINISYDKYLAIYNHNKKCSENIFKAFKID